MPPLNRETNCSVFLSSTDNLQMHLRKWMQLKHSDVCVCVYVCVYNVCGCIMCVYVCILGGDGEIMCGVVSEGRGGKKFHIELKEIMDREPLAQLCENEKDL